MHVPVVHRLSPIQVACMYRVSAFKFPKEICSAKPVYACGLYGPECREAGTYMRPFRAGQTAKPAQVPPFR